MLLCALLLACGSRPTPGDNEPGIEDAGAALRDVADPGRATAEPTPCNGSLNLCDRRYDQVTLPGTHNSMASEDAGFFRGANANHTRGVKQQLSDGIRLLMLDVYNDENGESGTRVLCHGPCILGQLPHVEVLADIAAFLDDNPGEVVSILYENYVGPEAIAEDLMTAGLLERAYSHPEPSQPWPTLGQLIEAGTPLVVTAQSVGDSGPPAVHAAWTEAWDTPYTWYQPEDFDCRRGRGQTTNAILLVNHWLSTDLDLPDPERAAVANALPSLLNHADLCQEQWSKRPNWLAVDYYRTGDLIQAVRTLNGLD